MDFVEELLLPLNMCLLRLPAKQKQTSSALQYINSDAFKLWKE